MRGAADKLVNLPRLKTCARTIKDRKSGAYTYSISYFSPSRGRSVPPLPVVVVATTSYLNAGASRIYKEARRAFEDPRPVAGKLRGF